MKRILHSLLFFSRDLYTSYYEEVSRMNENYTLEQEYDYIWNRNFFGICIAVEWESDKHVSMTINNN